MNFNRKVFKFFTCYISSFTIIYVLLYIYNEYFLKDENRNIFSMDFSIYLLFWVFVLPMVSIIYSFIYGLKNKMNFKEFSNITIQVIIYSIIQFTIMQIIHVIVGPSFELITIIELSLIQLIIFLIFCLFGVLFKKLIMFTSKIIRM